jgi:tetratricopeptide (TPR) repeat protein
VGSILLAQGDAAAALLQFQAGLWIRQSLAAEDLSNPAWQHGLATSRERIGTALMAQENCAEALAAYQKSLAIMERFAEREPDNPDWQQGIALCLSLVGSVWKSQGDFSEATGAYRDALAIRERLAATDTSNLVHQVKLAEAYLNLATVLTLTDTNAKAQARTLLEKGRQILTSQREIDGAPLSVRQEWLRRIEEAMSDL